jgi:hypothetical protein
MNIQHTTFIETPLTGVETQTIRKQLLSLKQKLIVS